MGVGVVVFLRYAGQCYVLMLLCSAPLHPSLCANTTAPQQTLKTDVGIEARGNIIAYRRSGLVQRRALLRVGRRIAPCLLCVDVCAMCHSRRYALGRGTGAALVNRAIVLRTTIATTQADTPQYRYANTPHRTCILRLLLIVRAISVSRPYNLNFSTTSLLFVV